MKPYELCIGDCALSRHENQRARRHKRKWTDLPTTCVADTQKQETCADHEPKHMRLARPSNANLRRYARQDPSHNFSRDLDWDARH